MGVRMGHVFASAKEFVAMRPAETEKLLESPVHEARAGASALWIFRRAQKGRPMKEKRSYSSYTFAATTESTIGTWSTAARRL